MTSNKKFLFISLFIFLTSLFSITLYSTEDIKVENTYVVKRQAIHLVKDDIAYLKPVKSIVFNAPFSTKVASFKKEVGQVIKKGDVIVQLEDVSLFNQFQSLEKKKTVFDMKMKYIDALIKAKLKKSKKETAETRLLRKENEIFLAQIDDLNFQILSVKNMLNDLTIKVPFTGIISQKLVYEGQQIRKGMPLFKLISQDSIVELKVDESLSSHVYKGKKIALFHSSFPLKVVNAEVMLVYPEIFNVEGFRFLKAQLKPDQELTKFIKPGAQLDVQITLKERKNVLSIPLSAIHSENGQYYAWKKSHKNKIKTSITLGVSNQNYVEIRSGLNEADIILN